MGDSERPEKIEDVGQIIKRKPQIIVVGAIIVAAIAGCVVFLNSKSDKEDYDFVSASAEVDPRESSGESVCSIHVDIAGAVENPGVYCLDEGSILQELIKESGGFRDDVCQIWLNKSLNMAEKAVDGQKIYVPFADDPECGAVGSSESSDESSNSTQAQATEKRAGYCIDGKISINTASSEILQELSGVGPSTAQKIIDGRPYSRLEDLLDVKGIGDATFDKLKDGICL